MRRELWLAGEFAEAGVEGGEAGGGDAGGLGAAEGLAPDGFHLDGAAGEVIHEAGGAVGAHGRGDVVLALEEGRGNGDTVRGGGGGDLGHEGVDFGAESGVGANGVGGDAAGGDAEAVERHVPDEFAPAGGGEVVHGEAFYARVGEGGGDGAGAFAGGAVELAEGDGAGAVETLDLAGGGAVDTDEAEAAEHALGTDEGGEHVFGAEAVLQGEHGGAGAEERGEEGGEGGVGGGLEGDDDEVNGTALGGGGAGGDGGGGEVAGFLAHDDFVAGAHGSEVAAEEKTHVMAGADEARAVIEAERARADDGDGERVSHALEEK